MLRIGPVGSCRGKAVVHICLSTLQVLVSTMKEQDGKGQMTYKISSDRLLRDVFLFYFCPEAIDHLFVLGTARDQNDRHPNIVGVLNFKEGRMYQAHGAKKILLSTLDKLLGAKTEAVSLRAVALARARRPRNG
jgi:hypothetical protein